MLTLGLLQLNTQQDPATNLMQVETLLQDAVSRGAELVTLPESFVFIGPEAHRLGLAEPLDGRLVERLRGWALRHGVWLMAGGIPERGPTPERSYNTAVLIDSAGELKAIYRKIHLFDVALADGTQLRESRSTEAGREVVVAETPWCKMGLSICYDLRFPELYRQQVAQGAELLLVPSAFTLTTGRDHWHVLLRARAIENLCYVAAPAQVGAHGHGRHSYGRSLVVNPWGQVLAEAADRPEALVVRLDFEHLRSLRAQLPSLQHRVL